MLLIKFKFKISFLLLFCLLTLKITAQEIPAEASQDTLSQQGKAWMKKVKYSDESTRQKIDNNQKALPYFKAAQNWDRYVNTLNWLSFLYYYDQQFEPYKHTALFAHQMAKDKLPKDNPRFGDALNNLANYYQFKGYNSKAIDIYLASIALIDSTNQKIALLQAIGFHNIGVCYRNLGDQDEAIYYFQKALALRQKMNRTVDPNIAGILADVALAYKEKKQFPTAISYYERSLVAASTISKKEKYINQTRLFCFQNLADIYLQDGKLEEVPSQISKAIALQSKESYLKDYYTYEVDGNFKLQQKKYAAALDAFLSGEKLVKRAFKDHEKHPELARCLRNKAKVYHAQKDFVQAQRYLQQALISNSLDFNSSEINQLPSSSSFLNKIYALEIIALKAAIFEEQSTAAKTASTKLEQAYQHYQFASTLIQEIRQSYLAEGSKQTWVAKVKPIYEAGIKVSVKLYHRTQQQRYLEQAFAFSEESKASLLLASIQEDFARGFSNIPDSLLQLENDLNTDITLYQKQIAQIQQKEDSLSIVKLKFWRNKFFQLRESYKSLIAQLEVDYPKYYALKYNPPIANVKDIQSTILDEETILLSYFIGKENNFLFCVRKDSFQVFPLVSSNVISPNVTQLRKLVTQSPSSVNFVNDHQSFCQTASALYDQLLSKALAQISPKVQQLILIPDGYLNYIPFEVLLYQATTPTQKDYRATSLPYLLNKFHCSYNYSVSLCMKAAQQVDRSAQNLFVGFAPEFGGAPTASSSRACSENGIAALNCNQEEVNAIAMLTNGQSLVKDQASTASFKRFATNSKIIHLATHACVDKDQAKQSKIYFSDDHLSIYDLYRMNFSAELVVLSACNTGQGQLLEGEGVLSLSRCFIQAGCPSSLMSLWAIDDCTSKTLMIYFYEYLTQGQNKDQALQNAKLKYIAQATNKAYAHPFYWAGFAQMGNTDSIDFNTPYSYKFYWISGLLLLILLSLFVKVKMRQN